MLVPHEGQNKIAAWPPKWNGKLSGKGARRMMLNFIGEAADNYIE